MTNSADGHDGWNECGRKGRLLLGFPGAGGTREGEVIRYVVLPVAAWIQPTDLRRTRMAGLLPDLNPAGGVPQRWFPGNSNGNPTFAHQPSTGYARPAKGSTQKPLGFRLSQRHLGSHHSPGGIGHKDATCGPRSPSCQTICPAHNPTVIEEEPPPRSKTEPLPQIVQSHPARAPQRALLRCVH